DVGCGSGRYGIALVRGGAHRAVGLDFSEAMIDLARREASAAGPGGRCASPPTEGLAYGKQRAFPIGLGKCDFDYFRDPLPHLSKMAGLCTCRLFASFPKRWEWRVPTRKLRFALQRSFVRFYSKREVQSLVAAAGLDPGRISLIDLGRDWLLVAHV